MLLATPDCRKMRPSCRCIGDRKTLDAEIAAWPDRRNDQADAIKWMVTTQTLATNYFEPIQTPTSHNHCAELLVVRHRGFDG